MTLVERDLFNLTGRIDLNSSCNLEHIADSALDAIFFKTLIDLRQIIARPDHQGMCLLGEQHQNLLSRKGMFVAP